ncbi:MAG: putative amidase, partial [Actinomycetia bacterium]|nr:putative amidase [Actinomycetes bacterium]
DGHWMWGSDYPHDEGTQPFSRECIRLALEGVPTEEKRKLLATNCAALYDFDMKAMDRAAAIVGPLVEELDAPLTELPANPNMALARAGSNDLEDRRMLD